ncbi:MAG: hypothetical protein Q9217_002317 [Psora testacea]
MVLRHDIECYDDALRFAEAQEVDVPSSLQTLISLARRLLANAREANTILSLAGDFLKFRAIATGTKKRLCRPPTTTTVFCPVHNPGFPDEPPLPLPPERARILKNWYFFKLPVHTYNHHPDRRRQEHQPIRLLVEEILRMTISHLYILGDVTYFLCECLEPYNLKIDRGIEDPDPPEELYRVQANVQTPAWEKVREIVTDAYVERRHYGSDEYEEVLEGSCDVCFVAKGRGRADRVCQVREERKSVWEL